MIAKGSLVWRLQDDYLIHLRREVLQQYPPEGSVCMVLDAPRKVDMSSHLRAQSPNQISVKSVIDVLYEGRIFYKCELRAFNEVKKSDRRDTQG